SARWNQSLRTTKLPRFCGQTSVALRRSAATAADARGNYHDFHARSWKRWRRVLSQCLLLKLCRGRLHRFLTISCSDSKCEATVAVGRTKSNKTVTNPWLHFARKSIKHVDCFRNHH